MKILKLSVLMVGGMFAYPLLMGAQQVPACSGGQIEVACKVDSKEAKDEKPVAHTGGTTSVRDLVRAKFDLAQGFAFGEGVARDERCAIKIYKELSNFAQQLSGTGIEQDAHTARVIYQDLAKVKFALAQSLRYGATKKARLQAYALYTSPELQDNPEALYEAGCLYLLRCADWVKLFKEHFLPAAEKRVCKSNV